MRRSVVQIQRVLFLAAFPVTGLLSATALGAGEEIVALEYSSLRNVQVTRISALPLNSPPIDGFVPQVVFGLTDQQAPNDNTFAARMSTTPGGNTLPRFNPPKYYVATFDTGAQSHILGYQAAQAFNLSTANRQGTYQADLFGASGSEVADVSDPLGIYMTGFTNASSDGSSLSVTPGTLSGQWNTSVLSAQEGSSLPNIIGSPIVSQYQTVIKNSVTRRLTVGDTTYRSPEVSFRPINTPTPTSWMDMPLDLLSVNGVSPQAVFIPSLDNFNNFADNPTSPTFWSSPFVNVDASDQGESFAERQFLFDTGAQVTVLSRNSAARLGIYTGGPNPTTPEFSVEVSGVGGATEEVPGFYLDTLRIITDGGPLQWTNVPILVLDLIDPRDAIGAVPGILGMNLFTDRDLILNGGMFNPYVAIGPQMTPQWNAPAGGVWAADEKWLLGVPETVDAAANFLSAISTPQSISVDRDYLIGSMKFDNANRYTINGPGRLTLQSSIGPSNIEVASGSHTINAPLTFASDTTLMVTPATSKLTISAHVTSPGVDITKLGAGTVETTRVRAAALSVNAGRLAIVPGGSSASTSVVSSLSASSSGQLDLSNNALIVLGPDSGGTGSVGTWNGSTYTGVQGLVRAGFNDGAWNGTGGIITTQLDPQSLMTLGVATAAEALLLEPGETGTWFGQTVGSSDVLVRYTFAGDANLDGVIDADDYSNIDTYWRRAGSSGYSHGDFNYDGGIDADDYSLIDVGYRQQGRVRGTVTELSAVPEPALGGVLMVAAMFLGRRRRMGVRSSGD